MMIQFRIFSNFPVSGLVRVLTDVAYKKSSTAAGVNDIRWHTLKANINQST